MSDLVFFKKRDGGILSFLYLVPSDVSVWCRWMCASGAREGVLGSTLSRRAKIKDFVSDKEKNIRGVFQKKPSRSGHRTWASNPRGEFFSNRSKNH